MTLQQNTFIEALDGALGEERKLKAQARSRVQIDPVDEIVETVVAQEINSPQVVVFVPELHVEDRVERTTIATTADVFTANESEKRKTKKKRKKKKRKVKQTTTANLTSQMKKEADQMSKMSKKRANLKQDKVKKELKSL